MRTALVAVALVWMALVGLSVWAALTHRPLLSYLATGSALGLAGALWLVTRSPGPRT